MLLDKNARIQMLAEMTASESPSFGQSTGVLTPILVELAELRLRGYSSKFLHGFASRCGIQIGYPALTNWVKKHVGSENGPGSKAESIVQEAVDSGSFASAVIAKKSATNGTGTSDKTPAELRNEVKTKPSGSVSAPTESVNPQKTIPSSATTTPEPVAFRSQPPAASVVPAPASVKPVQQLPPLVTATPFYSDTGTAVVTDSDNLAAVKAADKAAKIASVEKWMRDSEANQMGAIVARVISERPQDRRNS